MSIAVNKQYFTAALLVWSGQYKIYAKALIVGPETEKAIMRVEEDFAINCTPTNCTIMLV